MKTMQSLTLRILPLLFLLLCGPRIFAQPFTDVSPYPTPPDFTDIHALSGDVAFAVSNTGVILKTTNGGNTWVQISVSSGSKAINDIHFVNPLRGYAVGDASSIYTTTDGGLFWNTYIRPGPVYNLKKLFELNDSTLFATGSNGALLKTTNYGATWQTWNSPADNTFESLCFVNDTLGLLVTGTGEIYRTTDGGLTWYLKTIELAVRLRDVVHIRQGRIIAVGDSGTLVNSTNFGETWVSSNIGYADTLLQVHFSNFGLAYIIGNSGTIYTSADDGLTWSIYPNPQNFKARSVHTIVPAKIFFGGKSGSLATHTPSGQWTFFNFLTPGDIYGVSCADYDKVYVSSSSGTVFHSTSGYTYTRINTGSPERFYAIHARGDTAVWTVGTKGVVYRKNPTSLSFTSQQSGITTTLRGVYVWNRNTALAVGDSGTIIRTSNAGVTWQKIISPTLHNLYSVSFYSDSVGLACGDNGTILRTGDYGLSWTALASPVTSRLRTIHARNYPYAAAAGDSGVILWTVNTGSSWILKRANPDFSFASINFINSATLYAAVEGKDLYKVNFNTATLVSLYPTDGSYTFTAVSAQSSSSMAIGGTYGKLLRFRGNPDIPVELLTFSAKNIDGKILLTWNTATETNNRGFEVQKSINNKDWFDIGFVTGSGTATEPAVYTFSDNYPSRGIIYYRLRQIDYDGRAEILRQIEVPFESSYELEQNYPNPFNPATEISYSIPYSGKVSLVVYDALGREVDVLVNKVQEPGRYTVSFNGSSLASGIYYYKITAGKYFETRKMIILK